MNGGVNRRGRQLKEVVLIKLRVNYKCKCSDSPVEYNLKTCDEGISRARSPLEKEQGNPLHSLVQR